jgi:RNA polymerase sigma-70 factor (ECF subfamily)
MIQQHSGIIRKILYLYADNPEDQADLHQEILYQAWKSIDRFQGNSKFSTWLYRLALNTVLTHKRKNNRLKKEPMNEAYDQMGLYPEANDKSDLLWNAIKKLGDIDKTLISLHLEDYSNEEISEILGISKNHVAVKLHRIRQQLEKQLLNG